MQHDHHLTTAAPFVGAKGHYPRNRLHKEKRSIKFPHLHFADVSTVLLPVVCSLELHLLVLTIRS